MNAEGMTEGDRAEVERRDRQRRAVLAKEVERYVGQGYRVVSQTDYTAQLVKPKVFSLFWALIWLLFTVGIMFVVYLFWYAAKRDHQVYLTVDETGRVHRQD